MTETVDPTQTEAHRRWVQDGHCAAIKWTKAWCNYRAGHAGPHWAPFLSPPPSTRVERDQWTETECW